MTREEFHSLYERWPKHFKAELIGGTVFVHAALHSLHGNTHLRLGALFSIYEGNTPGSKPVTTPRSFSLTTASPNLTCTCGYFPNMAANPERIVTIMWSARPS